MNHQHQPISPQCLQAPDPAPPMHTRTTLRGAIAEGNDGEAIHRLAALTASTPPQGAVLLAERNGEPVAAIGIIDRQAVADPKRSTLALRMRLRLERLNIRLVIAIRGL